MSTHSNPHETRDRSSARCFVLTVSDTRRAADDESGDAITELLGEAGQSVVGRDVVVDDSQLIRRMVLDIVESARADVIIATGGTGIAPRDMTPEALEPLFTCHLEGFGEAFRRLSFDEIGPRAILSRAIAGVIDRTLVFALPGSPSACRLGVSKLILPVLGHALGLLRPSPPPTVRLAADDGHERVH